MIKSTCKYGDSFRSIVASVLLPALLLIPVQCGKSGPEDMIPIKLEKNSQFSNYAMYQFDDGGVIGANTIKYRIDLPEKNPSLLHARVISRDGKIKMDMIGPGNKQNDCEWVSEPGIFGCAIDVKNIQNGRYVFQIRSESGVLEKYNFYLSYRTK